MRVGAHLPVSKGLPYAARLADSLGADTFQFFTRNPRGGAARELIEAEVSEWRRLRVELDIRPLVGHLPYTVNMAAPRPETRAFATMVLKDDLKRAALLGAEFLVVHPGSHNGDGPERGIERIVAVLAAVLGDAAVPDAAAGDAAAAAPAGPMLLLEAMAGQGSEIGFTPAQLGEIIDRMDGSRRLGICLDTCHMFAAGYDLRTGAGIDAMLEEVGRLIGLDRIRVVHLNDSKTPLGSGRDRHELLGQGHLGEEGLREIVCHPFIQELPLIIETPVTDYPDYAGEIGKVRTLARRCGVRRCGGDGDG